MHDFAFVNSGFLFENRVAGPKVGPYILVQHKTYGSIWKLCQFFLLNIWKIYSSNLLLPWYFQVDCWKVPNNEIDEHVTILECLGGKPLESSVFHRDLTSKKNTLRFVESEIVFATWLDRSRVSWFFLSQMYEHKKNHLFCYWMNFWLVKNHQGFLKSCKLAPFEKKDKRPNSCAFGSGKLSCWREKQLATGKTPGILPFGTASVPDGRAHHAQRL